jgi:hypothetical protein
MLQGPRDRERIMGPELHPGIQGEALGRGLGGTRKAEDQVSRVWQNCQCTVDCVGVSSGERRTLLNSTTHTRRWDSHNRATEHPPWSDRRLTSHFAIDCISHMRMCTCIYCTTCRACERSQTIKRSSSPASALLAPFLVQSDESFRTSALLRDIGA